MFVFDTFIQILCWILVALTVREIVRGFSKRADQRADILVLIGLLAAILLGGAHLRAWSARQPAVAALTTLLLLSQPFFLLRLVERFASVPRLVVWVSAGAPIVGAWLALRDAAAQPDLWTIGVCAYFIGMLGYAASAFGAEAARAAGVTSVRLALAAAGTWLHVLIAVVYAVEAAGAPIAPARPALAQLLGLGVFVCYYAGLMGPRWFREASAQRGLAQSLRETLERPPEERARRAAHDLDRAAARGVASVARAVLLEADGGSGRLLAQAVGGGLPAGLSVCPANGLVGRAISGRTGLEGTPAECEPELAPALGALGSSTYVVPIASDDHAWGVLIVVQRHGSLFPEDDLAELTLSCRHTAVVLDHARLVAAERDRRQRAADDQIEASESRLRTILESIKDYAVLLLDDAGRIVAWKAGANQIFGVDESRVRGTPAAAFFSRPGPAFLAQLAEARRAGHLFEEALCCRQDGATFPASIAIRPVSPGPVNAAGFVVVARDETERMILEDRLRQAQKMEALGQLAGGIAHDFNNLLMVALGNVSALETHPAFDRTLAPQAAEIRRTAERAAELTRRLLAFSRKQIIQPRVVDLHRVVSDLVPTLERLLVAEVALRVETPAQPVWVLADPVQIEQIAINLVVNARDAMPAGGTVTVRVSEREWSETQDVGDAILPPGRYAQFTVADTGVGIRPEHVGRIFEPFFTTKAVGQGTGLGLSTVHGIVRQAKGGVLVDSTPGHGTTFDVFLPAHARETARQRSAAPSDPTAATILVVDDNDMVRRLVAAWLSRQGYTVVAIADPGDALARAVEMDGLDLVVTDVLMPGTTGPELVRRIRQSRPALRVLYVSGYAPVAGESPSDVMRDAEFLPKPFREHELLSRVAELLARPAVGV